MCHLARLDVCSRSCLFQLQSRATSFQPFMQAKTQKVIIDFGLSHIQSTNKSPQPCLLTASRICPSSLPLRALSPGTKLPSPSWTAGPPNCPPSLSCPTSSPLYTAVRAILLSQTLGRVSPFQKLQSLIQNKILKSLCNGFFFLLFSPCLLGWKCMDYKVLWGLELLLIS